LQAHDPNGLQTCSLRSAGIYGPGDRHRFPSILKAVRGGQMIYLGDGSARFDHVYITNLVEAHLGAARELRPGKVVGGQAYFITENRPGNFYEFFTPYLRALGWPVPSIRAPLAVAYALALVMEALGRIGVGPLPPLLTRYVVLSTCRDFYFSSEKAHRAFGYTPVVSPERAFAETLSWLISEGYRCPESLA
jgi:sterol-4alpha-carboxylate 3-dehydrogenase (decarboxylating)